MPNQSHQDDGSTSGGQLFEFVDEAHEVTDEERTRPRYGRPNPKPQQLTPPAPPQSETREGGDV
jgi:hypothetical protein